ncbi:hypothetical protein J6TS2_16590 [Heyndrickxia sporothermodurans]|nr:hypothetical protein J6TS2_16590 [Heyndrickxia sporothermodurans]
MIDRLGGQVQPIITMSNSVQGETKNLQTAEPVQSQQKMEAVPKEKLEKIVDSMNEFVSASNSHLKFEFHDKLNEYYVTVVDDNTQEVVKEIPSKKMLDMYAAMTEFLGIMVDKKI